jgi:CRISPR/Cas system endoribonuclease Cas6 (RAMP superfamily)
MATGATMSASDPGSDSELMNYLVRMVVPMRREFGRQLDVRHFLHDLEYARDVIQQALTSQDARLLQYAKYVEQHHLGPRNASNAAPAAAQAEKPAVPTPTEKVEVPLSANPTAEEMRERVLRKYTSGLR